MSGQLWNKYVRCSLKLLLCCCFLLKLKSNILSTVQMQYPQMNGVHQWTFPGPTIDVGLVHTSTSPEVSLGHSCVLGTLSCWYGFLLLVNVWLSLRSSAVWIRFSSAPFSFPSPSEQCPCPCPSCWETARCYCHHRHHRASLWWWYWAGERSCLVSPKRDA